jgi:hypothetical protein
VEEHSLRLTKRWLWGLTAALGVIILISLLVTRPETRDNAYIPLSARTSLPTLGETRAPTFTASPTVTPRATGQAAAQIPQTGQPTPVPYLTGQEYFAAPTGSPDGDGSQARPWDLQTALTAVEVGAGDVLWLREGVYTPPEGEWRFVSKIEGTADEPVIVRGYPGERATINGCIEAYGPHTWFWGFEITNLSEERDATQEARPPGLTMIGAGQKAINLVVHDVGHPGIGFWEEVGDGGEIYGTLIWGVGLYDANHSEWTRGSGIYTQNQAGIRQIRDVISFRNFTYGIKVYAEGTYVNGFHLEGTVTFDNPERNILVSGRDHPFTGLVMLDNYTYRDARDESQSVHLGYPDVDQGDAILRDNYFVSGSNRQGALWVKRVQKLVMTGNTLVSRGPLVEWVSPQSGGSVEMEDNTYYARPGAGGFLFDGAAYNFNQWQKFTQLDGGSEMINGLPEGTRVFVRPNEYEPGRGHIIIYNWDEKPSVSVDVSKILQPGQPYRVLDAQNYYGDPVLEGVWDGQKLDLPMDLTETSDLIGNVTHIDNSHTGREFNVFVVIGE